MELNKKQMVTSYIKHLAVSGLSSVSARIKISCNLTGKCFEMPNVSYTQPLPAKLKKTTVQIKERFDKLKIEKQKQDIRVIGFYSFGLIIN